MGEVGEKAPVCLVGTELPAVLYWLVAATENWYVLPGNTEAVVVSVAGTVVQVVVRLHWEEEGSPIEVFGTNV